MFIVFSHNLEGTSDQCIHCLTDNYDKAVQIYTNLTADDGTEKKSGHFVELLLIPENYESIRGHKFNCRSTDPNIKVLRSFSY